MPSQSDKNQTELLRYLTQKSTTDQQAVADDLRVYARPPRRLFRQLRRTALIIPFWLAITLQIAAVLVVTLSVLPPLLPIPTAVSGSISLSIIIFTMPATVIGPLIRLIANNPRLNLLGLQLTVKTAAGATIPAVALSMFTQSAVITIISILAVLVSLLPIFIIVINKPPKEQVIYALVPVISFFTITIILSYLPLHFTVIGIILALMSTGILLASFIWGVISIVALTPQRVAVG